MIGLVDTCFFMFFKIEYIYIYIYIQKANDLFVKSCKTYHSVKFKFALYGQNQNCETRHNEIVLQLNESHLVPKCLN